MRFIQEVADDIRSQAFSIALKLAYAILVSFIVAVVVS